MFSHLLLARGFKFSKTGFTPTNLRSPDTAGAVGGQLVYLTRQNLAGYGFLSNPMSTSASRACFCSLSGRRFAAEVRQQHGGHHAAPTVTPRYTDDIPEQYYKYGAFKTFTNRDTISFGLLQNAFLIGSMLLIGFLNNLWSCRHWHYKHRLVGSYLESD
ncbi:hypothetical protein CSUI_002892 [Cystoisospora suis]|uniref:Transmembrane protein n=1 Tax=Cystoisospora suis TaxID=483139 RepID=A0A2C6L747_9APIC|nr:hypothetical protein CSUI_002892 [Cystoisospora suis]